jgi:hypothetical protein
MWFLCERLCPLSIIWHVAVDCCTSGALFRGLCLVLHLLLIDTCAERTEKPFVTKTLERIEFADDETGTVHMSAGTLADHGKRGGFFVSGTWMAVHSFTKHLSPPFCRVTRVAAVSAAAIKSGQRDTVTAVSRSATTACLDTAKPLQNALHFV